MTRGAGGTPGGLLEFFIGCAMVLVGGYMFLQRLTVTTSFRVLWGENNTGIALLIVFVGIGLLFFRGRSIIGWILVGVGAVMIFITVISNLVVYFERTSLFQTILMFILLAGGLGLVARALRPHNE